MIIIVSPVQFVLGLCFLSAIAFGFGVSVGIGTGVAHEPVDRAK